MKHINRWYPDTCGCVIEYEWDDSEPEDKRTHRVVRFVKVCDAHKKFLPLSAKETPEEVLMAQEDKERLFSQVLEENRRKNYVLFEIINKFPEFAEERITPNGEKIKDLRPGISYQWRFDDNRRLIISIKDRWGLVDNEKKLAILNHLKKKGLKDIDIE